ncbi:hypothetical protein RRG08_060530, partial [Elysia crispata]
REENCKKELKKAKPKSYKFDSEDNEPEEVIVTRRNRNGRNKGQLCKRASRALNSDSDEDPLPDSKPKAKRKKKEIVSTVVDSDEEEKKMTALDKFVIHNQKTPSKEAIKAAAVNGQVTPKGETC